MPTGKYLYIISFLAILFIPLFIYTKKFTAISAPLEYSVTVNPQVCYKCRECSCEYTLYNGKQFKLNKIDKSKCILDSNQIVDALNKNKESLTFFLNISEYSEFYDCIIWYSSHRTADFSSYY